MPVLLFVLCFLFFAFVCDRFFVVHFAFRWHPRLRLAARALPLCGAALTFFAAAKKVSKESGLTPPVLDLYPRALNVPALHAAGCWLMFVANVLAKRPTRFMHPWRG
ncbi:hypothetical protein GCT13_17110 [Paraburkholderia sp. CNPSo 3157]|uniref:Uncharacterized protein n=1 Tax=Paraburkholderia franconis TaxID=2654983 RepID=A0A7X1NAV1_9BURK|nr:hypothetical protein [Paraburkholderia franconis]MPW18588.1 hypothetical protein [Paraburkholderia franconis]